MNLNLKRQVSGSLEAVIDRTTEELKKVGFGILTRIDFHTKMKEKLGKDLKPVVILGACNPGLAYEAFQKNTDVTSLIPCNATIREVGENLHSVELTKPSALMEALGETQLAKLALDADRALEGALSKI